MQGLRPGHVNIGRSPSVNLLAMRHLLRGRGGGGTRGPHGLWPRSLPSLSSAGTSLSQQRAQYIISKVKEAAPETQCFQCSHIVDPSFVLDILDEQKELKERYIQQRLTKFLLTHPDAVVCPAPDCEYAALVPCRSKCPRLSCGACNLSFCSVCRVPWHQGVDCSSTVLEIESESAAYSYQRCPSCNFLQTKDNDGRCSFVSCRICGIVFCWLCGQRLTLLHYSLGNCSLSRGVVSHVAAFVQLIPSFLVAFYIRTAALVFVLLNGVCFSFTILLLLLVFVRVISARHLAAAALFHYICLWVAAYLVFIPLIFLEHFTGYRPNILTVVLKTDHGMWAFFEERIPFFDRFTKFMTRLVQGR